MFEFSNHVTLGDLIVTGGLLLSAGWHYFGIVRRQNAFDARLTTTETKLDDLRRGRGLIMGDTSDWPNTVRRCFGFGPNGGGAH